MLCFTVLMCGHAKYGVVRAILLDYYYRWPKAFPTCWFKNSSPRGENNAFNSKTVIRVATIHREQSVLKKLTTPLFVCLFLWTPSLQDEGVSKEVCRSTYLYFIRCVSSKSNTYKHKAKAKDCCILTSLGGVLFHSTYS